MEIWNTPQNILSAVLVLVTLAYTITSAMTWWESREVRKQKSRPCIIVYMKSNVSHDTLYLCVKNIGEGYATKVKIIPVQDYAIFGKSLKLKDFALFSEGIDVFPPQFEMNIPLNTWNNIHSENNPIVSLEAYYCDMKGKETKDGFNLPLKQMATLFSEPPASAEERIPYYLHEIQKELKSLGNHC